MYDVFIDLIANLIWFLLGILTLKLLNWVRVVIPIKRLWQLTDPENLMICASASTVTDTGEYFRPATGIGQIRALALAFKSLNRAYRELKIKNILLSTDPIHERLENDLVFVYRILQVYTQPVGHVNSQCSLLKTLTVWCILKA